MAPPQAERALDPSRDEALQALNEAAQAYIEVMVEKGQSIPEEIEAADSPVVAVSV